MTEQPMMMERWRMERWMRAKGFDMTKLALAVGDSYANVYIMMTSRGFGDAFKWRFLRAFGFAETASVFIEVAESEVTT